MSIVLILSGSLLNVMALNSLFRRRNEYLWPVKHGEYLVFLGLPAFSGQPTLAQLNKSQVPELYRTV